ncbi:MAG: SagB family peptide dehydrogenase [Pseudomonadota bacterium]
MKISGRTYHDLTSYDRHRIAGHALDWGTQPDPFKRYCGLETVELPQPMDGPDEPLSAVIQRATADYSDVEMDLERLSRLLWSTHAITARTKHGGAYFHYRSVASAGALYPFECYLAAHGIRGLDDGLFHHAVQSQSLTRLRSGDTGAMVAKTVGISPDTEPTVVFFLTAVFFRSSWKYRDRAYRYHLLDTGHLAENLSLACSATGLRFRMTYDFNDDAAGEFLGLDSEREACLAVAMAWGRTREAERSCAPPSSLPIGVKEACKVSDREFEYPAILEIHRASEMKKLPPEPLKPMTDRLGLDLGQGTPMVSEPVWPEVLTYSESVFGRRSRRNYTQRPLDGKTFQALVGSLAAGGSSKDKEGHPEAAFVAVGFIAHGLESLANGFYVLDTVRGIIHKTTVRPTTENMADICLNQAWLARCSLHFVFMADLRFLDEAYGPRGYRYAMLTAGRLGQRLYLTATSLGLGCCGIGAFYDVEAALYLGLAPDARLLYLVAAGPVKKPVTG